MRQVGSIVFWLFVAISSLLLFPIALLIWLVTVLFDKRLVALHRFTCFWASIYTWTNPVWRVHVTGRENIEPDQTYVLIANHLSLLDILVLFRLFRHFKWVSKASIFKVPCVGWNMSLNRYIPLRRGDKASIIEMMSRARATLASGSSVMMFPEGTRSATGELRAFKPGAFDLAKSQDVPIVPMVIAGSSHALPKSGFVLQGRHDITVTVLPAVPIEVVRQLSIDELSDHCRAIIQAQQGASPAA